jgi:endonuclease G
MHARIALAFTLASCAVPTSPPVDNPDAAGDPEPPSGTLDPTVPPAPDSPHLQLGVPTDTSPDDDLLIIHDQFAVSYNRYLDAPNWVSYLTRPVDFGPAPRFAGPFYPDDALPAEWFHPDTNLFNGSGYDRGHMLRSEERTDTEAHNIETFVLTNVLPQRPDLNRGVWFDFELYVQHQVQASHEKDAYEIAGAIWPAACATHAPRIAGDGCPDVGAGSDPARHIAVPSATWKVVVFVTAGVPLEQATDAYVVAVLMPNISGIANDRWWTYRTTVAAIEQMSGYDIPRLQ